MSVIKNLTASQVNASSVGDTYTDVSGNTYAETTHQTRMTAAGYTRLIQLSISAHVSGGTGTFQLYNNTDGTSLGTVTTTATSETLLSIVTSNVSTNNGDDITIRVKNDTAGQSCTIDAGGIISGDKVVGSITSSTEIVNLSSSIGGFFSGNMSLAVLKQTPTATLALQVGNAPISGPPVINPAFGAPVTTSDANTVVTIALPVSTSPQIISALTSATGTWYVAASFEVSD